MILGAKGTNAFIYSVGAKGDVLAAHEYGSPGSPYSLMHALNGATSWDPVSKSLLYVPENPYLFLRYDPSRGLAASTPRNDPSFRTPPSGPATAGDPGDRVMKVTYLPDGDLLAQVVKRSVGFSPRAAGDVMHSSSFIELFDSSLKVKATGVPVDGFGFLQGADAKGGIYFNLISMEDGIHVVKARLQSK